jgi:hypothetical protein
VRYPWPHRWVPDRIRRGSGCCAAVLRWSGGSPTSACRWRCGADSWTLPPPRPGVQVLTYLVPTDADGAALDDQLVITVLVGSDPAG